MDTERNILWCDYINFDQCSILTEPQIKIKQTHLNANLAHTKKM